MINLVLKNYVKKDLNYIRRDNILIKDIPVEDRPRERLISKGVSNLSNEELLSIIIKDGTFDMSVKDISCLILNKVTKLQDLRYITYEELINTKGIGKSKACTILAAIELGNRINTKIDNINNVSFTNASIIYEYYHNKIGYNTQENFYCVYLDSKNRIIKDKLLFIGTINYSMVHPRDIYREAYLLGAVSIICIHNHPTGIVEPSNDDIKLTKQLEEVSKLLGINLLDHIIIGKDKYYSFLEHGII